jgi:hypothetical protein
MSSLTPEQSAELEARIQERQAHARERYEKLRKEARAVYRAVAGWHSVKDPDGWDRTCEEARQDYCSGRFLIERLGAERFLDPTLMATLWRLRQKLVAELPNPTTADYMLVDMAVVAYHNALRVQNWIGDMALYVEHEWFGQPSPAVKMGKRGSEERLAVEERLNRLGEQLLPLLDRANRMMLRNLKAIRELRQAPVPGVAIGRAEQVNVAEQQANAVIGDR